MDEEVIKEILSRKPRKILTKTESYLLYEKGIFGNKALTWNSYDEILKSNWTGKVCIRSKKGISRKDVRYNLEIDKILEEVEKLKELGHREEEITFNQSMPDEHLLLQGELMTRENCPYLFYTTVKKPMNIGLAEESKIAEGHHANKILKGNLSEESYNELIKLMMDFPESVIEFSTYSIPVGNLAHLNRNTVFWEVRNY
ncbi:MAG: hypothetical protein ABIH49_03560 [archaeon]